MGVRRGPGSVWTASPKAGGPGAGLRLQGELGAGSREGAPLMGGGKAAGALQRRHWEDSVPGWASQ